MEKNERMSKSDIEKSRGDGGGDNEMNVEGEGDREGSDVSHPRGPRFDREEREGIGGENKRDGGTERSSVGPFRESMEGHVGGKGEDREFVGTTQTEESTFLCVWMEWGRGPSV